MEKYSVYVTLTPFQGVETYPEFFKFTKVFIPMRGGTMDIIIGKDDKETFRVLIDRTLPGTAISFEGPNTAFEDPYRKSLVVSEVLIVVQNDEEKKKWEEWIKQEQKIYRNAMPKQPKPPFKKIMPPK